MGKWDMQLMCEQQQFNKAGLQLLDLYHRQFSQVIYLSKAALLLEIKSTGVLSSPFPSLTLVMPENKINKYILNLYLIYNIRLFSLEHW